MSSYPQHPVHHSLGSMVRASLLALWYVAWLTVVLLSALSFTSDPRYAGPGPGTGWQQVLVEPGRGVGR